MSLNTHEHLTIIINWFGPFTYEEIANQADDEENDLSRNGLYLATGKLKYQREDTIQYCGITEGSFYSRIKNHHKIWEINREQQFWLGKIAAPSNTSRHYLEMAEKLIVYFWQPELNERKRIQPPKPTTVINYWLKKNGSPRFRQEYIYRELDDVLSWDGEHWRTGNLKVYGDS